MLILLTLLIILIVPVLTVTLQRSSHLFALPFRLRKKEPASAPSPVETLFREAMASLQVALTEIPQSAEDESDPNPDKSLSFEYQGGHFIAILRIGSGEPFENSMSVSYFSCFSIEAEYVDRAGELSNRVNSLMLPIKCTFTESVEEGDISFSLHSTGIRLSAGSDNAEYLKSLLLCFFRLQRMLFEKFQEIKSSSPSEVEANRLIFGHQLYALSRMEVTEQAAPASDPVWDVSSIQFGTFVNDLFCVVIDSDSKLYLNGKMLSDSTEEIIEYPFLQTVVSGSGANASVIASSATLSLRARSRESHELILSLSAEKIDDRLITVRVNALLSALPVSPFRAPASEEAMAQARTLVIGIPCVTPEAFLAEAKYMAEELSLLEKCKSPNAAYCLYWGKLLYTDGRFIEAEHYLRNAYDSMLPVMAQPDNLSTDTIETFYDVCYFLGVVYCALGRYHDAYYYLDLIVNQHRVLWTQQYVCCLMAMRDPRCPSMIEGLIENIKAQIDQTADPDGENDSQLTPFIDFLERQLIIIQIREGKTDEARLKLAEILTRDPDSSFALYWLSKL